jgi:hypothetical protein
LHTTSSGATTTHPAERFFAILGALACLGITIPIWLSVSAYQSMWPLPALYLIEMVAVSIFTALLVLRGGRKAVLAPWVAAGILTAFSILGAFSVGFFYLPSALIFGLLAVFSDVRRKGPILGHLGLGVVAGLAKAALMLAVVGLH